MKQKLGLNEKVPKSGEESGEYSGTPIKMKTKQSILKKNSSMRQS